MIATLNINQPLRKVAQIQKDMDICDDSMTRLKKHYNTFKALRATLRVELVLKKKEGK